MEERQCKTAINAFTKSRNKNCISAGKSRFIFHRTQNLIKVVKKLSYHSNICKFVSVLYVCPPLQNLLRGPDRVQGGGAQQHAPLLLRVRGVRQNKGGKGRRQGVPVTLKKRWGPWNACGEKVRGRSIPHNTLDEIRNLTLYLCLANLWGSKEPVTMHSDTTI